MKTSSRHVQCLDGSWDKREGVQAVTLRENLLQKCQAFIAKRVEKAVFNLSFFIKMAD